ncbi:MAG: MFS transporter [Burkholderiaceae bacterium]|nr:MFS transporter [Burkholderiaceae bacterium]
MNATARWQAGALRYSAAGLGMVIFWLLLGAFAIALRERSALPGALELLRRQHASDTTVALLLSSVPALLGMVLGPLVSYHSDRHRGRRGRRLPYLLATTPIGALAMVGLAASPMLGAWSDALLGAHSPGLERCVLVWFCLCWGVFECIAIMTLALYAGLVNDVIPFPLLGRFFAAVRVVSLGAGILFNYWLFALTDTHLFELLAGMGILFGLGTLWMCAMVKEGAYPPLAAGASPRAGLRQVVREFSAVCFSERRYLWTYAALTLALVGFTPFNTFYQYYAAAMGLSKTMLGELTAAAYLASIVLALLIGAAADRWGALRVSLAVLALYVLVSGAGFAWVRDTTSFAWLYVAHVVVSGAYYTASATIPMALFPRLHFLQFNAAKDLMVGVATIVTGLLQGPLLDWSGHDYRLTLASAALLSTAGVLCLARAGFANRPGMQRGATAAAS